MAKDKKTSTIAATDLNDAIQLPT